ncbi:hypothetical protein WN55_09429 [Dufourea novaeangliae]|uniref:Uncharacterized protein n=1 Tax=Dufourea novaeangliae TaxID=178035 RepID=A0A154P6E3_DUFNO|nr:hypothetical protein WN55_09429 [Dufourea novaeangliae]
MTRLPLFARIDVRLEGHILLAPDAEITLDRASAHRTTVELPKTRGADTGVPADTHGLVGMWVPVVPTGQEDHQRVAETWWRAEFQLGRRKRQSQRLLAVRLIRLWRRQVLRVALKKRAVQGRVPEGAPGLPKRQMKLPYADTPDRLQRILHLTRHLAFNLCKQKSGLCLFRLTGISALETFVKLEGEGNVDLHHLHLGYAWRMCHYASTAAEHQFVAVNTKYDHVPAQINRTPFHLIDP